MSENTKTETYDIDNDTKVSTILTPCIHNGELAYKQVVKTMKYSKLQGAFKLANKKTNIVSYESVHPDFTNELTIPIIIKRSAIDTVNVQNISAFFKTTSTITVNNPSSKLSLSDGKPFLHMMDGNVVSCQSISAVLPNNIFYSINISEDLTRISTDEVLDLLRKGVQIYHENPASKRPEDRFRIVLQEA